MTSIHRLSFRRLVLIALMAGVASLYACGGSSSSDLLSGDPGVQQPQPPDPAPDPQPDPDPTPDPDPIPDPVDPDPDPDPIPDPDPDPDPDPTPDPDGSELTGACFNPILHEPGSSRTITRKITSSISGAPDSTDRITITMKGPVTFNDRQALDEHSGTTHSYYAFVDGYMEAYGGTDEDGFEYVIDPMHRFPVDMEVGKTYASTATLRYNDGRSLEETQKMTFLGYEPVNVPAGSFETCKIQTHIHFVDPMIGAMNVEINNWHVASGPYMGIMVKAQTTTPIPGLGEVVTLTEAVEIETNY